MDTYFAADGKIGVISIPNLPKLPLLFSLP